MRRAAAAGVLFLLVAGATGAARADEPQPTPERIKAAAEEFDRGRRAYLAKEYEQAAVHFESAYRDAPRAETLRLAIRARREAKQLARAATLAAIAQQRYASDPSTRDLAQQTLDEATPQLQTYDVECTTECGVTADGRVVSQSDATKQRLFLDPGPHDLGVSFKTGSVARHVEARKGGRETLTFEAPAPVSANPNPNPNPSPNPNPNPQPEPPPSHQPLGPVVFFIAAGVTLAAGGATIWSGIDTQNNPGTDAVRRQCAGKDESCPAYQDGRSAQLRTNVLVGVTAGAALATAVIGLFLTDWSGKAPAKTTGKLMPTPLGLSGTF